MKRLEVSTRYLIHWEQDGLAISPGLEQEVCVCVSHNRNAGKGMLQFLYLVFQHILRRNGSYSNWNFLWNCLHFVTKCCNITYICCLNSHGPFVGATPFGYALMQFLLLVFLFVSLLPSSSAFSFFCSILFLLRLKEWVFKHFLTNLLIMEIIAAITLENLFLNCF